MSDQKPNPHIGSTLDEWLTVNRIATEVEHNTWQKFQAILAEPSRPNKPLCALMKRRPVWEGPSMAEPVQQPDGSAR
jgi:hypothetical protein